MILRRLSSISRTSSGISLIRPSWKSNEVHWSKPMNRKRSKLRFSARIEKIIWPILYCQFPKQWFLILLIMTTRKPPGHPGYPRQMKNCPRHRNSCSLLSPNKRSSALLLRVNKKSLTEVVKCNKRVKRRLLWGKKQLGASYRTRRPSSSLSWARSPKTSQIQFQTSTSRKT